MESKLLVPKLRFPEFRDAPEWELKPLRDVTDHLTEKVGDRQLIPVSISAGTGFVSQAEKFGRDISGAQYRNYIHLRQGDFSYNKGNSKRYPQGCVYELKEFEEAAAPSAFVSFRFRRDYVNEFFQPQFEKNSHGRELRKFITSGARSDGLLNVSPAEFFSIQLPVPHDRAEQQKIAECLTSLDEVIAAEGRKLEALRTYKNGLMQNLFPREGEAVPRIRFPEFRDAPEWEQRPLGLEALFFKGRGVSKADVDPNGLFPCIRYGELYTRYGEVINTVHSRTSTPKSELFLSSKNDVLIPASGETKEDIATASCVMLDGVALGGDINVLRTNHNGVFLSYLINAVHRRAIAKVAQGHTVVHLYPSQLAQVPVVLPEAPEQQKIAECLTSLDELIAAQRRKLDPIKVHKQGLMQGLFPSVDEGLA